MGSLGRNASMLLTMFMVSLKLLLSSNTFNMSPGFCWQAAALPRASSSDSRLVSASNESGNGDTSSSAWSSTLRLLKSLKNLAMTSKDTSHPGHALMRATDAWNAERLPHEYSETECVLCMPCSAANTNSLPPHAQVAPAHLPSGKFFLRTGSSLGDCR